VRLLHADTSFTCVHVIFVVASQETSKETSGRKKGRAASGQPFLIRNPYSFLESFESEEADSDTSEGPSRNEVRQYDQVGYDIYCVCFVCLIEC